MTSPVIHPVTLRGILKNITFHNPDNGYSVLRFTNADESQSFTVVGNFPKLSPGEELELQGELVKHATFGEQLRCSQYKILPPNTPESIQRYLSSGVLKGVGPAQAKWLVAHFGLDTFKVLDEAPHRLKEVSQLKAKKRANLLAQWEAAKGMRDVIYFLQSHHLSLSICMRVYQHYGPECLRILKENPYRLADDLWGIGFLRADEIAGKMGFAKDSYYRIKAGLVYALSRSADEGHVYQSKNDLLTKTNQLLGLEPELLIYSLDNLKDNTEIIIDEQNNCFRPYLYHSELGIARKIADLQFKPKPINKKILSEGISLAESRFGNGFAYSEQQKSGIELAANSGVFILTGGPGTGKTTTVMGILHVLQMAEFRLRLTAPTGRAAKRLTEVTGLTAVTIHRLLKYEATNRAFAHTESFPLEADVIIVDEVSMIDTSLMYSLLRALAVGTRLILIGDPDQLPSVGPGKVLSQLIDSKSLPHLHLDEIFRQAKSSLIVTNAHRINKGLNPEISTSGGNFHLRYCKGNEECLDMVENLVCKHLPEYFGYKSLQEIQVLTPMNRGPLGTQTLNSRLQAKLNPVGPTIQHKERSFRVSDKVMQLKNNYDKNVFNGDLGYIVAVSLKEKKLIVKFDENEIEYALEELDQLTLAYASTIHKSQGSEFKAVVLLLSTSHFIMLQRNLFYTAVTRAKERLFLIGQEAAVKKAVEHHPMILRNTRLAEKLSNEMHSSFFGASPEDEEVQTKQGAKYFDYSEGDAEIEYE